MINMLIYGCGKEETEIVKKLSKQAVAHICDKKLNIVVDELDANSAPDLAVINICENGEMNNAYSVREHYKDTAILLISGTTVSPMKYLNPYIHPLSLIIKPYEKNEMYNILEDFIRKIIDENEDGLWIDTYGGKIKALFSNIIYIEASNKMLDVRLDAVKYSVYGSLEQYEKRLPGFFARCHRGVIVNIRFIEKIRFSENYIKLKNGEHIPLSRTYKQNFKEMVKL